MASHTCSVVCADCSAPGTPPRSSTHSRRHSRTSDPKWALINKGVLVCDDCCSAHRLLGRHISDVRSLTKSLWPPTLLEVETKARERRSKMVAPRGAPWEKKEKPKPAVSLSRAIFPRPLSDDHLAGEQGS